MECLWTLKHFLNETAGGSAFTPAKLPAVLLPKFTPPPPAGACPIDLAFKKWMYRLQVISTLAWQWLFPYRLHEVLT